MKLTPEQNQAQLAQNADLIAQCTAYKALLAANKLPLSVDMTELTTAYRQQLFDRLLTVDPGLKARYELLRTEEGRQKLLFDTINTDGHELLDQVRDALAKLTRLYSHVSFGMGHQLHQHQPLATFAKRYTLDLNQALAAHTISWEGKEYVLAYFEGLLPELERVREIFRPLTNIGASMGEVFMALSNFYHEDRTRTPMRVDEHALHERLLPGLEQHGLLGKIPRASK
ncbi:hypothetical protein [Hymenobacter baengnokdamensis]|uniref:hypothetical protein n=1 Tax=Hymenobacter baengnokdamensis TaxID=2615203 RepID=UPI0012445672|nr:hypothetical protein [Hymenobacter baengnokdamensis]